MIRRVALFDIDGTLLTTHGRAVQAMMAALDAVYEARPESDGYLMDGKTELRIVHELLRSAGRSRAEVEADLPRFWTHYEDALKECIHPEETTVYPGVRELLARLRARGDVALGLLTGNCPAAARIKLDAAGLDGVFPFGAFGDRHEARQHLPGIALDEAHRHGLSLKGKAVTVLGDTPNDILCALPLGLRTIAVATGRYGRTALAAHRPDFLFSNFVDAAVVEAAILAE